jgi:hypothetical protein
MQVQHRKHGRALAFLAYVRNSSHPLRGMVVDLNRFHFGYSNAGRSCMKKYLIVLCIAAVHFVFTKTVAMITFSVFTTHADDSRMSILGHFMIMISRVLYFPVITMAWYPRRFFPGNLIIVPLFINSMIWAILIYMMLVLVKRWRAAVR